MTLKVVFKDRQAGPKLRHGMKRAQERIAETVARTLEDVSQTILREGRANIAGAGRFGKRWTEGLRADIESGVGGHSTIRVWHEVPYFSIFEYGGKIHGKPLLWIPLSFSDAVGKSARDYGGLFRVDRISGGAPLLLSVRDGQPKYSGHASVTIPRKFRIREIAANAARRMREFYSKHFRAQTR